MHIKNARKGCIRKHARFELSSPRAYVVCENNTLSGMRGEGVDSEGHRNFRAKFSR